MIEHESNISDLSASGFTRTSATSFSWCEYHINKIKDMFGDKELEAYLWSYRHSDTECFSFDICCGDKYYTMTLSSVGESQSDIAYSDYNVFDLVEALHIVGIFTESLNVTINIGRRNNEVNEQLLARPLLDKETNGSLRKI